MKLLIKLPLLVLLTVFSFSCSTDSIDDNADAISESLVVPQAKPIEIQILELINNHRLSVGLNPLENLDLIKAQAYSHTEHMVSENTVSHDNFYVRSNYLKANAGAKVVSENVAYGYTYDIGNYFKVSQALDFSSSVEELNDYISTFRW